MTVPTYLAAGIACAVVLLPSAARPYLEQTSAVEQLEAITRIRQEALVRSQALDSVFWLADVIGPRPSGGEALTAASDWAAGKLKAWGLSNVSQERFPIGDAWMMQRFSAHLLLPHSQSLIGTANYWSASTNGFIEADAVMMSVVSESDLPAYRGKLQGKIVLVQLPRPVPLREGPFVLRMGPQELMEATQTPLFPGAPDIRTELRLRDAVCAFAAQEGAAAVLERGADDVIVPGGPDLLSWRTQRMDGGTVFPRMVSAPGNAAKVPSATLAVEHYNQLARLLQRRQSVRLQLEIRTVRSQNASGVNTLAEIPGTSASGEVVILGAHLDSWHAASGATDNAAGVAAVMEAVRAIRAVGVRPMRTIRLALWDAEEHGLLGSRAYVTQHFANRDGKVSPDYDKLYIYLNVDSGAGRARGLWTQGNIAAIPILQDWIKPLEDVGVTVVSPRNVGNSDHLSFEAVGLPSLYVMQDRLEYSSSSHHSNMDVFDRVQYGDIVQLGAVLAVLSYQAAIEQRGFPRKGFPPKQLRSSP